MRKSVLLIVRGIIYHASKPLSVPTVTTSQMEDQSKTFD